MSESETVDKVTAVLPAQRGRHEGVAAVLAASDAAIWYDDSHDETDQSWGDDPPAYDDTQGNPAGLRYEVTLVLEATDTEPERRTRFAAFADAVVADWFTDQLVVEPGTHFETRGLEPPSLSIGVTP